MRSRQRWGEGVSVAVELGDLDFTVAFEAPGRRLATAGKRLVRETACCQNGGPCGEVAVRSGAFKSAPFGPTVIRMTAMNGMEILCQVSTYLFFNGFAALECQINSRQCSEYTQKLMMLVYCRPSPCSGPQGPFMSVE